MKIHDRGKIRRVIVRKSAKETNEHLQCIEIALCNIYRERCVLIYYHLDPILLISIGHLVIIRFLFQSLFQEFCDTMFLTNT